MAITLDGTTGITTPGLTNTGTETIVSLTTTGNTILGDATTDTLTVGVTGIVKDASGNVGIGTASPVAKLQVGGSGDIAIGFAASYMSNLYYSGGWKYIGNGYGGVFKPAESDGSISFQQAPNNALGANAAATPSMTMSVTAAGLLQFNSGYGSAATAYGCRAWVNFNGTGTVAIRSSGNVSSITDNGVGDYTVNFTTALVDINYSIVGSVSPTYAANNSAFNINSSGTAASIGEIAPTVSACRIITTSPGPAALDAKYINISIFR